MAAIGFPTARATFTNSRVSRERAGGAANALALSLCARQSGLCALNKKIPLKLCHGVDYLHGQPSSGAGEVCPAQGEAMYPDTPLIEEIDRRGHVDGVPPKPVELGDDKHVALLHLLEKAGEAQTLHSGNRSRDGIGDDTVRLDLEACGFNLARLVLGRLLGR